MWVETYDGAVNLDFVAHVMVEEDGLEFRLGFWMSNGGYQKSTELFLHRSEARQVLQQMIDEQNHPLRVVQRQEETHDQHDETGTGARAPE